MKLLSISERDSVIVKLVVPTDFEILEAMSTGQRQTAPNLSDILEQRRQYMNDRLSALASMGLVRKVGPSDRSGMYEITAKGLIALKYKNRYQHDRASDFARFLEAHQLEHKSTDKVIRDHVLHRLYQDATVFSEIQNYVRAETETLEKILNELESLDLVASKDINGDSLYALTQAGEMVVESLIESENSPIQKID